MENPIKKLLLISIIIVVLTVCIALIQLFIGLNTNLHFEGRFLKEIPVEEADIIYMNSLKNSQLQKNAIIINGSFSSKYVSKSMQFQYIGPDESNAILYNLEYPQVHYVRSGYWTDILIHDMTKDNLNVVSDISTIYFFGIQNIPYFIVGIITPTSVTTREHVGSFSVSSISGHTLPYDSNMVLVTELPSTNEQYFPFSVNLYPDDFGVRYPFITLNDFIVETRDDSGNKTLSPIFKGMWLKFNNYYIFSGFIGQNTTLIGNARAISSAISPPARISIDGDQIKIVRLEGFQGSYSVNNMQFEDNRKHNWEFLNSDSCHIEIVLESKDQDTNTIQVNINGTINDFIKDGKNFKNFPEIMTSIMNDILQSQLFIRLIITIYGGFMVYWISRKYR